MTAHLMHDGDSQPASQSVVNTEQYNLPPFERLPPEIAGSIFRRCFHGERIIIPIREKRSTAMIPWVISQVCSRWRNILMSDSTIWSSMTISYENIWDKEALTRKVEEIILPRIKLNPISFESSNLDFLNAAYYSAVIPRLIIPNLARFRHLTLSMHRIELEPLITSPPGLMESLESLKLDFTSTERLEFFQGSITVFEDAPNLRKVHFTSKYFCEFKGTGPLTLPWGQLTNIDISLNLPYAAVIQFLPHCTQLVSCRLSIGSMNEVTDEPTLPAKFVLPQLQSITLYSAYIDTHACPTLLQLLILPSLKEFTLRLFDEVSVQSTLLELIDRSRSQLEHLEISGFFTDAIQTVAELLQVTPSLKKLVIPRDHVLPTSVIKRMMTGELVPILEAIHCQVASLPLMLELLETRRSGRSPRAPVSYRGILCSVIWGHGLPECKCETL
ncbi:hypothetical protein BDZ94DRAFT_741577 [Collybia nuda]|uniref:F-box domain-containing protein n=1 Tax=Collybia nuda TaxID=64659 RepID=A0A9P6CDV7_9AGAR|nr:hypothetical protein BDZ94DRAFT_741577 [Collybia nuda]